MKIAFIIFEGMTALDFIGVYDPIVRLKAMGFIPDLQWDICAPGENVPETYGVQTPSFENIWRKYGKSIEKHGLSQYSKIVLFYARKIVAGH